MSFGFWFDSEPKGRSPQERQRTTCDACGLTASPDLLVAYDGDTLCTSCHRELAQ
ncbi:hypothetical protein J0910_01590 [Nocardiopsis sp. CNT-189]|uniref:hypothetical protein n=1 Tax=Nocardiopsis oceanisediminis TaxID=2816862 RepID=UPI003B2F8D67